MAVMERRLDGSYRWACNGCGCVAWEAAHRGPRKRLCRSCQNNMAYRKRQPEEQRMGRGDHRRWLGSLKAERGLS